MTLYTTTTNGTPTGLAPEEFASIAIIRAFEAGYENVKWEAVR